MTQKDRNRLWMRAYRATPEGKAATAAAKRKRHATPEGRAVRVAGRTRWKKSAKGREYNRKWGNKKYVHHPRPRLSEEERKARAKASWLKSVNKPDVKSRRKKTTWRAHIRRQYGLNVEQYNEMAKHGCQICGKRQLEGERPLGVDHDHLTGAVRGVLCDPCNRGLACFRDSVETMAKAASYLARSS